MGGVRISIDDASSRIRQKEREDSEAWVPESRRDRECTCGSLISPEAQVHWRPGRGFSFFRVSPAFPRRRSDAPQTRTCKRSLIAAATPPIDKRAPRSRVIAPSCVSVFLELWNVDASDDRISRPSGFCALRGKCTKRLLHPRVAGVTTSRNYILVGETNFARSYERLESPRVLENRLQKKRERKRQRDRMRKGRGEGKGIVERAEDYIRRFRSPRDGTSSFLPFRFPFAARYRGNELLYAKFMGDWGRCVALVKPFSDNASRPL